MVDMRSGPSLETCVSQAFNTIWHPALLSKLYDCGIHGQLHTSLTDFLCSHRQRVACNGILSSPPPVKARVPQWSVLGPTLFLIFINDHSNFLENPLYLFSVDSTMCCDIPHPLDKQAAASSLSSDLQKNHNLVKHSEYVFQSPEKSHTLPVTLSGRTIWPMIFLGQTTFQG